MSALLRVCCAACLGVAAGLLAASAASDASRGSFSDDFETVTNDWIVSASEHVAVIDSGDPAHGKVLSLTPAGGIVSGLLNRLRDEPLAEPVYALISESASWRGFRLEGSVYVPEDGDSYLGFVCQYRSRPRHPGFDGSESRTDFASVYLMVRAHESYIRINAHYDWNPARALYEEYRVDLEGDAAVALRQWTPFAAEVVGQSLHFYVGDLTTPRITFALADRLNGLVGFTPRVIGTPVWVDDIRAVAIDRHSYLGPPLPVAPARGQGVLTNWQALGPFSNAQDDLERNVAEAADPGWQPFAVDPRGAIVAARLVEHRSPARYGYFRTQVSPTRSAVLEFSTAMPLAVWIDGEPARVRGANVGRFDFRRVAWFDFREGANLSVDLAPGPHAIVVRARSDYSGTGFFARLVR